MILQLKPLQPIIRGIPGTIMEKNFKQKDMYCQQTDNHVCRYIYPLKSRTQHDIKIFTPSHRGKHD